MNLRTSGTFSIGFSQNIKARFAVSGFPFALVTKIDLSIKIIVLLNRPSVLKDLQMMGKNVSIQELKH